MKFFYLDIVKLVRKEVNVTFSNFVEDNFQIFDSRALKLRCISELWYSYNRLGNIGISLEEFYR